MLLKAPGRAETGLLLSLALLFRGQSDGTANAY
jgi:hypothetical protein